MPLIPYVETWTRGDAPLLDASDRLPFVSPGRRRYADDDPLWATVKYAHAALGDWPMTLREIMDAVQNTLTAEEHTSWDRDEALHHEDELVSAVYPEDLDDDSDDDSGRNYDIDGGDARGALMLLELAGCANREWRYGADRQGDPPPALDVLVIDESLWAVCVGVVVETRIVERIDKRSVSCIVDYAHNGKTLSAAFAPDRLFHSDARKLAEMECQRRADAWARAHTTDVEDC